MRTSPIHYIAPSAISITPNANGSQRDLAVYIARNTKIRVCYQPIYELGYNNANYKEWSLRGRNRRLAELGVPYTIYARLNKTDQDDGYLVFSKQIRDNSSGEWRDPYILTPNTSTTSAVRLTGADGQKYQWGPISDRQAANGRSSYWWVKIGEVTVSDEDGDFTVSLDTGILGTDQYNMDWYLNPDGMPERPVREITVERGEWTLTPMVEYTGETGATVPDGTLNADIAMSLGWTGSEKISLTKGQTIVEPYHYRRLTRDRWLTHRLSKYEAGYSDAELYKKLTSPVSGWGEENWVETSRVWHKGKLWECQVEGTTDEPGENSSAWKLLLQSGMDGESGYDVALTKSSDSAIIDPSGNIVGGYRMVSKDSSQREYYSYRFFTSVTVMKGENYLHLCGALDDDEELGEGNFTIEAIGAGCDLKMEGTTCYITGIWHCNDGNAETPNTSYSENPEEYQLMRSMTECVAHITLNIEGKTAVTKDYRLQLVHLPTDTVVVESHNEVAAVNWSTKKNAWTNTDSIVIPLTAASGGQPVRFQTVNGETGPDIRLLNKPTWLSGTPGFTLAWVPYKDGAGNVLYPASQHMAVEITIPIANIRKNQDIKTSNLLRFNVVTTVDGVEYENIVPFTLNMTTDKAVYVLAPSVRQVVGTMIGGTWDAQAKNVTNARYSYSANGAACNNVSCRLMSYDENNTMTEITNASDIHDNLTFYINGQQSSLAAFRAGLSNTAVSGKNHNLYDELSEIVFTIRLDGNDYESEGVPILRNGAQLTVGSDGYWYIGGVKTEVFAKGTEVFSSKIYYTDPMSDSTPPVYAPTDAQRGNPVSPYLKTQCPASVEGKFIHYVSITIFSDSEKTYVYSYGTIGTGNTITVIHDRDYYASSSELTQAQLKSVAESKWSESTPADYSATNKYLYARDTARYFKNGAEQNVTVGGTSYPKIVYNLLSYWGQDGSGVEFAYYRANDDSTANKPSVSVLNQRHPGTAKNPVIPDWNGSDGGWYDDNPGFTAMGQVMYQSVNKYSNGTWSGWDDPVIIDRYATNSVRLALDNEHEDFLYDGTTLVAPSAGASSPIRLYDGGKDITASMPTPEIHSVSGTTSGTGGAYINNKTLYVKALTAQECEVIVKCTYNGTTYYAKFTANKTNQDKYDIVCKPSSIAYNSTTHAAKADSATIQTVSLSATGIGIGGTNLSPSLSTSVGAGRLCVFWAYVSSNGTIGSFSGSPVTSKAVTKQECETYAGIYFELRYYTSSSAYRVCDYETVEIAKTKDGANGSALVVDLTNRNISIPLDEDGHLQNAMSLTTAVQAYYDTTEVTDVTVTDISGKVFSTDNGNNVIGPYTITVSGRTVNIAVSKWTDSDMTTLYAITEITMKVTCRDASGNLLGTRTVTLSLTAFKSGGVGDNAMFCDLMPQPSVLKFARTASGGYDPASRDLTVYLKNVDGKTTELKLLSETGYTCRYSYTSFPTSTSDGTAVPTTGTNANKITGISPASGNTLYLSLFSGTTRIDFEDVPIVSDGKNGQRGDDAVTYDIVFTEAWAKATPEGVVSARLRGHAYKIEGNNRTPIANAIIRYGYNTSDSNTYTHTTTNSQGYFSEDTWFDGNRYAKESAVFASIIIDSKAVCTKFVTIVQEAADGKPGHVGRWYYYAGDWQSGATYTMQETQGPFVRRGNSFYMLDFGTSDAKTGTTQLDPASNNNPVSGQGNEPWTLMQSTMQYYIAQAIFGPYAHFGSFIINGDWMISQYGTLVYSNGTRITVNASNVSLQYGGKVPYAWFDPTDPTASSNPQSGSYKFIPNFAVDGLTGKTYQNDAYVRGEIHATSGEFAGTLDSASGTFTGSVVSSDNKVVLTKQKGAFGLADYTWAGFAATNSGVEAGDLATIGARLNDNGYDYGRIALVKRDTGTSGTIDNNTSIFMSAKDGSIEAAAYKIKHWGTWARGSLTLEDTEENRRIQLLIYTGADVDGTLTLKTKPEHGTVLMVKRQRNSGWLIIYNAQGEEIGDMSVGGVMMCVYNGNSHKWQ